MDPVVQTENWDIRRDFFWCKFVGEIYPPYENGQKEDSLKTSVVTAFSRVNYKQTKGCINACGTKQLVHDGSRQPAAVVKTHKKEKKTTERYCFLYTYTYIRFLLSPYSCFFLRFTHTWGTTKTAVTRPSATEQQQQQQQWQQRVSG